MKAFREHVSERLSRIEGQGLRRHARDVAGPQDGWLWVDGRRVLCLCSNNYLGLARHPALLAAVREALELDGFGAAASRQVSGNMRLHRQAELALAHFLEQEAGVLFASGYACNTGVLQALADRGDVIFSDRLNHASLIDGARLSRAEVVVYEHADIDDLRAKLHAHRHRGHGALVVTESLFSMDGDVPPLRPIAELARAFDAGLVVDEAHALGVLGPMGRGMCAEVGVVPDVTIATLGKAFGGQGAFALGTLEVVDLIRNRARSYVFSTAPSPAMAAAALAGLRLIREADGLRRALRQHAARLREGLHALDYRVLSGDGPIIPVVIGTPEATMALSSALFERGLFVHGIRPPTVPAGTGRLRIVPIATHTTDDIDHALSVFAEVPR